MSKFLLYGSFALILAIGAWFYSHGEDMPDGVEPLLALLFAVMSFAYASKARNEGNWGAGDRKIRKEKSPLAFQIAMCFNYLIAAVFLTWGAYLLLA